MSRKRAATVRRLAEQDTPHRRQPDTRDDATQRLAELRGRYRQRIRHQAAHSQPQGRKLP